MTKEPRKTVEHDIDILVLEEIHVSLSFRRWLVKMATGDDLVEPVFVGAWRSVSETTLGESDVVFLYRNDNGQTCAVLVEDKVTSPAQPKQGERYRLRGKSGIESGQWCSFATLLLAPQEYLSQSTDASRFDAQLSYEALRDWFLACSPDNERMAYKARVIERAINRMKDGWARIGNATVTNFFLGYWHLSKQEEFKRLGLREPFDIPRGHNEISYPCPEIEGRNRLQIVHKFERGSVDLRIAGAANRIDKLRKNSEGMLPDDVMVVPAGKSAAFRIVIPDTMDRTQPFENQAEVARKAMRLGIRLLDLSFRLQTEN